MGQHPSSSHQHPLWQQYFDVSGDQRPQGEEGRNSGCLHLLGNPSSHRLGFVISTWREEPTKVNQWNIDLGVDAWRSLPALPRPSWRNIYLLRTGTQHKFSLEHTSLIPPQEDWTLFYYEHTFQSMRCTIHTTNKLISKGKNSQHTLKLLTYKNPSLFFLHNGSLAIKIECSTHKYWRCYFCPFPKQTKVGVHSFAHILN